MAEPLSIKHWRQIRDITQQEMANRLNVHVNTYRQMEKTPMQIKMITLLKICKILNVSISDIILRDYYEEEGLKSEDDGE